MRVDAFDFDLPEACIALRPLEPRDIARLLVVRPDTADVLSDHIVRDLPGLLAPGDALVVNDTRVIPARLFGTRTREVTQGNLEASHVNIEVLLHRRLDAARWVAFARPGKRLKAGDIIRFGDIDGIAAPGAFEAKIASKGEGGEIEIAFSVSGPELDIAIARFGDLPLPPYIASKRATDARDAVDYQTMFARAEGAVAAPTAGLHFTPALMDALAARGVSLHKLTLHVGAGTFLPVKADDTSDHRMHAEYGEVDAATADALNAVRARGGRVIAVGTTSLRLLESAADVDGTIRPFARETDIFITPGYRFRAVDALMTNFHLPRSTLFMLVSAFCGLETMCSAYAHAIASGYRFYSYGDASLLFPQKEPA
jgi:S-adenosylmethionine:tRNA ribosyltransferase-isomerase